MVGCRHPHHRHPEHAAAESAAPADLVRAHLETLKTRGMRRTKPLERLLAHLAENPQPQPIARIQQDLGATCDPVTTYRIIERLVDAGAVRRIGLHHRALFYQLVIPGRHHDYLICTACGAIGEINATCPVHDLETALARDTGYQDLHHDLVFYGICPECA